VNAFSGDRKADKLEQVHSSVSNVGARRGGALNGPPFVLSHRAGLWAQMRARRQWPGPAAGSRSNSGDELL